MYDVRFSVFYENIIENDERSHNLLAFRFILFQTDFEKFRLNMLHSSILFIHFV